MKKVVKVASPAAIAVLRQATAIAPKRMKASDGLLPSAAHLKISPNSDHNTGLAVDLTHDPKNGIDCAEIFEKLKEDERVSYLIFNKKIWSRKHAKSGNRPYSGSNPHTKHLHVSIHPHMADDTSPSVEPYRANVFRQDTLSGAFVYKNRFLKAQLAALGMDDDDVWASIISNEGSVQHLDISDQLKEVFKTAMEIDQRWLVELAADRQKYIDQGQSINLFFHANVSICINIKVSTCSNYGS